jgi:hypothetical protein
VREFNFTSEEYSIIKEALLEFDLCSETLEITPLNKGGLANSLFLVSTTSQKKLVLKIIEDSSLDPSQTLSAKQKLSLVKNLANKGGFLTTNLWNPLPNF